MGIKKNKAPGSEKMNLIFWILTYSWIIALFFHFNYFGSKVQKKDPVFI